MTKDEIESLEARVTYDRKDGVRVNGLKFNKVEEAAYYCAKYYEIPWIDLHLSRKDSDNFWSSYSVQCMKYPIKGRE